MRLRQIAWVVFYLPEIEADFLALYGKEVQIMSGAERDTAGLSGPRFLNYCEHLASYRGAVRGAAERLAQEQGEAPETTVAELMLDPDLEVSRG